MSQDSTSIPAGWYADPRDPNGQRYWDGLAWTDHTRPLADVPPTVPVPPPAAAPGPSVPPPTPTDPTTGWATPAAAPAAPAAPPPGAPPGPAYVIPPAPSGGSSGMSGWLKAIIIIAVLLGLLFAGCSALIVAAGRGLEEAADSIDDVTIEGEDGESIRLGDLGDLVSEQAEDVGSREDPLAYGETVDLEWQTFGDADGSRWATRIGAPTDLTDAILSENSFNSAPPDGVRFVGFEVELTLLEADKEPLSPGFNVRWEILGGATNAAYDIGTVETESFGCGVVPSGFDDFSEVYVGGTLTGTVCIPLPVEDLDHPGTRVALHFADDSRAIFGTP